MSTVDTMDWPAQPYHLTVPAVAPQADFSALPAGGWLATCPVPLGDGLQTYPATWWTWFERRRDDEGPMFSQRGPDGRWRSLSWREAWAQALRLATALRAMGLKPGKPLATLSGNSIEQGVLRLAALGAGVPLLHFSPAWALLSQDLGTLRNASQRVPPAAVFVQDAQAFARALAVLPGLPVLAVHNAAAGHQRFEAALAHEPASAATLGQASDDTVASVYFTSGSTGMPKAVPITHGMLRAQLAIAHSLSDPLARGPMVMLDWLPWHHVFAGAANLGRLLVSGGHYLIDEGRPLPGQFEATLRNLRDVAPTTYASSPLALMRLVAALELDEPLARHFFSRLQGLAYGGASLPRETWERWQRLALRLIGKKIPITSGMGSTETTAGGMALYYLSDDEGLVGLPMPGVQLKLLPLQGQPAGSFEGRFELRMRGPQVFKGYIAQPELTAAAFDEEGYYRMGDAVRFAAPAQPLRGLQFAGRVAEDFKLASGTWVSAGAARLAAISLLSPLVSDAIVCGHNQPYMAVLAWPNEAALRALHADLAALPLPELITHPCVVQALGERLAAGTADTNSTRVERVALLATPARLDTGEITDKGYINQARALQLRAAEVAALFEPNPGPAVACRHTHT